MNQRIEVAVIGGGQAGLATSYHLTRQGREHIVLEQAARPAHVWADERWDSFTLVIPNWAVRIPGAEYRGSNPDGFMERNDIVAYFEQYTKRFKLPVQYGVRVTAVEPQANGYLVKTDQATYNADNVVVATGCNQKAKSLPFSRDLPASILQMTSAEYRDPRSLPPGAVLVVGSAQSGCQIAEELYQSGRKVYLCIGASARVPRRYRGKDIATWLDRVGFFSRTPDQLPSSKARFVGGPQVSGRDGGHSINLHQFARDGVVLLGHLQGTQNGRIILAPDLRDTLAKTDASEAQIIEKVDGYIKSSGIEAPEEQLPTLRDGYQTEVIQELDLAAAGISAIIWAMGFSFDFSMVRLPLLDGDGYPIQQRGVTDYPGLYFVGLPFLTTFKSGLLLGVGDDAAYIASHIAARTRA